MGRQLASDVPVCSVLSGGIDSTVVTAIACNLLREQGRTLNTFSFDFTHNEDCFRSNAFQSTRDHPYVDRVLSAYPIRHTYLECDEAPLADLSARTALLAERFRRVLENSQAPVHRFLDSKKAVRFLAQPKDYGRPWFGQLMAGPQMIAYFLQVNDWMERYGIR